MKVRGFLPKGKGFLNETAALLSPDGNKEEKGWRSSEVALCFIWIMVRNYYWEIPSGKTNCSAQEFLDLSLVLWSAHGFWFSGLPGAGMEWTSWMRVSSMRWRPRLMGLSMCLVRGPCPPTESHGEKVTPTLLYTTFVLLSKVAESWALGYCFVFEVLGTLGFF